MRIIPILALTAVAILGDLSAEAQSAETATPEAEPAAVPGTEGEASPPGVVDRWQADRATIFDGAEVSLDDFLWIARPVIVFANTPADPAFQDQIALLLARTDALVERDVVLITDADPAARSEARLKLRPRGFMLAILGKDGNVVLRKPLPWDVRELTRTIDKTPERRRELDERALRQ